MKAKIVRIGNSRGVRLPKLLLEESGLKDEVELRLVAGGILIEGVSGPRNGWADAAALVRVRGEDRLLDDPITTDFDEAEWIWV